MSFCCLLSAPPVICLTYVNARAVIAVVMSKNARKFGHGHGNGNGAQKKIIAPKNIAPTMDMT